MRREVRVQGAIVREGRVLLVMHREHGSGREYWLLPGGGAEADESDEVCLAREVEEETHLRVAVERLLFDDPTEGDRVYRRVRTYLCRPLGGEARPGSEPEPEVAAVYAIAAVAWVDLGAEAGWDPVIRADRWTYPLLKRLQVALGRA
jgi:8-oxo-dGTP pyrophosphatase MutT (NUDIX family)